ncbi:hypothetical protein Cgig2_013836 [Carnegiea gigantea]|uniref:Uncharacterized protein n=1 Tax=Carnegiea gigantea TaxID=171969 RepID=A0A9Q1JLQ0_9CARY|nr:hypothetical protein Cgig2_013836 [Carnegiea gigantea]
MRGWNASAFPPTKHFQEQLMSCSQLINNRRDGALSSWRPADRRHLATQKRRRARGQTTKPPSLVMADTKEMADHVRETFRWHLRGASRPPHPLPKDYQALCPSFALLDVEEAACDFNIPEIVQAIFYAMLLNDAMELSLVSRDMAGGLKSILEGLRVNVTERESNSPSCTMVFPYFLNTKQAADFVRATFMWCLRGYIHPPQLLPKDYCSLCPRAQDFHVPELTRLSSTPWCSMMP